MLLLNSWCSFSWGIFQKRRDHVLKYLVLSLFFTTWPKKPVEHGAWTLSFDHHLLYIVSLRRQWTNHPIRTRYRLRWYIRRAVRFRLLIQWRRLCCNHSIFIIQRCDHWLQHTSLMRWNRCPLHPKQHQMYIELCPWIMYKFDVDL